MPRIPIFRRLVRFRLATMLVLVTVLSVWLGHQVNVARRQRVAVEKLRKSGAIVHYNEEPGLYFTYGPHSIIEAKLLDEMKAQQTLRSRLAECFGIDFFYRVVAVDFYDADAPELAALSDLPTIERLTLESNNVRDEGLASVSQLHNLKSLELYAKGFTKEGVRHLNRLRKLTELDLTGCTIGDADWAALSDLKNLELIILSDTHVTDNGLKYLKQFPKLKCVILGRCNVGDDGLASVCQLPELESLYLSYTRVSDTGLQHLRGHASLKHIELNGTRVRGEGIRHLVSLPKLTSLYLRDCELNREAIVQIGQIQQLEFVCVTGRGKREFTEEDVVALQTLRPKLKITN